MNNDLEFCLQQVNDEMCSVFDSAPKALNLVMQDLKNLQGKNIRAKVVIATAIALDNMYKKELNDNELKNNPNKALGNNELNDNQDKALVNNEQNNEQNEPITKNIIKIAGAIEILHLATLLHDDVIDDAPLRRGKQSIQAKYGKKLAVIGGDYLFTKCFSMLADVEPKNAKNFVDGISLLCTGEALQMQNNMNFDITKSDYKSIITGKTAGLFSLCTYSVAIEKNTSDKIAEQLARVGYYMGMTFQLIDDALDYEGDTKTVKKEVAKDLKEGVITYPLIYAMTKDTNLKQMLKNNFESIKVTEVVKEVVNLGGVKETKKMAKKYYNLSINKIDKSVGLTNATELLDILNTVYNRKY